MQARGAVPWREGQPSAEEIIRRGRGHDYTLFTDELTTLLGVAIGNPTRTEKEQRVLVAVANPVDPKLAAEAAETWLFQPCEACSAPVHRSLIRDDVVRCPDGCFDNEAELTARDVAGGQV